MLVTGAASGMGEATARLVAGRGPRSSAVDVREPSAPVAEYLATDLRDEMSIDETLRAISEPWTPSSAARGSHRRHRRSTS